MSAGLRIASGRETMRVTWALLAKHPAHFALTVIVLMTGAAAGLVAPWSIGRLVDLVSAGQLTTAAVCLLGAAILSAALFSALASWLGIVLAARLFEVALADLREQFLDAALALPQEQVEAAGSGELVSRASDDIAEVSEAIPMIIPALAGASFTIALTLAGVAVIDVRLALALLITLPVYTFTVRWYLRTAPQVYAAERSAVALRAHHVLASLRGIETVLAFRWSEQHSTRITDASWQVVRLTMRARAVQSMFFARLNLAEFLGLAALLVTAFLLVDTGGVTLGAATASVLLFLRLFDPIGQLLFVLDDAQSAAASLARVVGVTAGADTAPPAAASLVTAESRTPASVAKPDEQPVAALDRVTFTYVGSCAPTVHGVTLRIEAGEHVALVGASGAGKSTVAALLSGIHTPGSGEVRQAASTALLSQETHVFEATLAENLRLAAPAATDEMLLAAMAQVGGDTMLSALPSGLETQLGVGGHTLTPADSQLLALARLVLHDPELAILDEATAEADSAQAQLLDRASAAAIEGRSALVIAHRLSQAAICDRVFFMSAGHIVESGTHVDLLTLDGHYAELWRYWRTGRG